VVKNRLVLAVGPTSSSMRPCRIRLPAALLVRGPSHGSRAAAAPPVASSPGRRKSLPSLHRVAPVLVASQRTRRGRIHRRTAGLVGTNEPGARAGCRDGGIVRHRSRCGYPKPAGFAATPPGLPSACRRVAYQLMRIPPVPA
jgi:hypothetical protein